MYTLACEGFFCKLSRLDEKKRDEEIKWYVDRIKEIDNGTFDVVRFLYHPIRFWFNEYRHVIKTHFPEFINN